MGICCCLLDPQTNRYQADVRIAIAQFVYAVLQMPVLPERVPFNTDRSKAAVCGPSSLRAVFFLV